MRKNVDRAARADSPSTIRSKLQYGSDPRTRCIGYVASAPASATAAPACREKIACFTREAPPRKPTRDQRHGTSTSCVNATAKRAPRQRGGSTPSRERSRSSGGAGGARDGQAPRKRPCSPSRAGGPGPPGPPPPARGKKAPGG